MLNVSMTEATGEHYLTIDPGLAGTGVAIWSAAEFNGRSATPVYHKAFRKNALDPYLQEFSELIKWYGVTKVWIENAHYHGTGSAKGQMVASSGGLVKLAKFIGAVQGLCFALGVQIRTVDVPEWKGQLPKEVVNKRILAVWPECACTTHDWDAVGIGLYLQRRINVGISTSYEAGE